MGPDGDWETAALEAAIVKLTARSPDELFVTNSDRARERFDKELAHQIAEVADADEDPGELLQNYVFENDDADPIVETDVYPRNAGMASGFYQALKAIRLPSGARIYFESGEWESDEIRGIAAGDLDAEAAARFGEIRGLPTYFRVGDQLLEIDQHLSAVSGGGWIHEALFDHEAEWIEQDDLDRAEERRAELQRAIDEAAEEDDAPEEQLDHAQATLDGTPPWFLLLEDSQLDAIAAYALPERDRSPLENRFHPWMKPTREMFLDPDDPANLQHIVAAYLVAR